MCIVAILVLVITVWITCWTQEEQEREAEFGAKRSYVRSPILVFAWLRNVLPLVQQIDGRGIHDSRSRETLTETCAKGLLCSDCRIHGLVPLSILLYDMGRRGDGYGIRSRA